MQRPRQMPKPSVSSSAKKAPPVSPRRKWLFRLFAVFLIPTLLLGLLELGLRLGGYGYRTEFFLKETIQGKEYYVENPLFGYRFFPPGVARSPTPIVMPVKKEPGTLRIFLFGESAALGDPKPAFGMGRYLETLLRDRYAEKKFEVICVAMTAINSHVILPIARECVRHDGDLWIIYMGNNETIGPFGGATIGGKSAPGIPLVRTTLALKSTRIGQLLENLARREKKQEHTWRGLAEYMDRKIASDDPVRARVDQNFRRNLEDILRAARRAGVKTVLSAVSVNLADCSPHASMHKENASTALLGQWEEFYRKGQFAAKNGLHAEALTNFTRAAELDGGFAEEHFRAGLSELQLSNVADARREFQLAVDCDALAVRTTSRRNQIIREVANANPETISVSLDETLAARGANNVPGREVFFDHVHFNFDGNYVAARALGVQVEKALGLAPKKDAAWMTQENCEAALALTDWNRFLAVDSMLARLNEPLYTNQLTTPAMREALRGEINTYRQRVKTNRTVETIYKEAIKQRPSEFYLYENYAEYLELKGDSAGAVEQWKQVSELLPHHPIAYFHAGRLDLKTGKLAEAETELRKALEIRPDFAEAQLELGQALRRDGKKEEAVAALKKAVELSPENPVTHFNLADALAFADHKDQALEELKLTIRMRPSYWEARYLLGVELALMGRMGDAEREFREVVKLRPGFAQAHFNLGVALAREKRFAEAVASFEKALEIDPANNSAREQLGSVRSFLGGKAP